MMALPDGRKSFKMGLAVLIQYRRVTDTQPASHVAVAYTALCYASTMTMLPRSRSIRVGPGDPVRH